MIWLQRDQASMPTIIITIIIIFIFIFIIMAIRQISDIDSKKAG